MQNFAKFVGYIVLFAMLVVVTFSSITSALKPPQICVQDGRGV